MLQYDENNQLERKRALFYDQRGRLIKEETHIFESGAPSTPFTKNWTYDSADRLASLTYPAEKNGKHEKITYSYNNYGQLIHTASHDQVYVSHAVYDRRGRIKNMNLGNHIHETWDYASPQQGDQLLRHTVQVGSSFLQDLRYPEYDALGQLQRVDDHTPGYSNATRLDQSWAYAYNGLRQLSSSLRLQNFSLASFSYDAKGNMTLRQEASLTGNGTQTVDFSYNNAARPHQAQSLRIGANTPQSMQHESGGINGSGNGGLTYRPAALGSPAIAITYNKERKASSITAGGNTVAYRYNEAGLRVSKRVNNQLTLLDPHYEWHSSSNDLERKVYFGSRLLAISKGTPQLAERTDCRIKSNGTIRCRTAKLSKAIKLPTKYGLGWELANQNERKYVHAPTTVSWTPPYENASATALIKIKLDDRSNSQCSGTTTLRITADEVIERGILNRERLSEKLEIPVTGNTPIQFEVATTNNCQERLRGDITIKYKGNITNTAPTETTTRSTSFLHRDHRASTTLVTDKTAAIQQYARYEAYGMTKVLDAAGNSVPLCSATTPYLFTGHRLDCHTNLHDMKSPGLGLRLRALYHPRPRRRRAEPLCLRALESN